MKVTMVILSAGLVLCGCVPDQTSSKPAAFDRVAAGGDTAWHDGVVLHIAKRNGAALEGIRINWTTNDGHKTVLVANSGTVAPGSLTNAADVNAVRLILNHVHIDSDNGTNRAVISMAFYTFALRN